MASPVRPGKTRRPSYTAQRQPSPNLPNKARCEETEAQGIEWGTGQLVLVAEPSLQPGHGQLPLSLLRKMAWQEPARGLTEVLSAVTPSARDCPPPPARRSPWQPEGQCSSHTPHNCQQLGPHGGKRGRDPALEAAGNPAQWGRGHEEEDPREQPPASSRALMPAPDLTNPRGPGSPLHRVLGEGPRDYTHHNDVDGWLRPPKH